MPQPFEDTTLSVNITGNASSLFPATWLPTDFARTVTIGVDCDCSAPSAYYYNVTLRQTNTSGACLLACDGPRFPFLLGLRRPDCLEPGFCQGFSGCEMDSISGMQNVLTLGQPSTYTGPETGYTFGAPAIDTSATGALAGHLLAARFNLDYIAVCDSFHHMAL